ncbi:MAG: aspartate dehydrogenase [Rhodospirillaceae bacterium]|jgi:aspartate dehydrogenase|nr:aspartate dehydrogenase [Rhodospirillaceae bacterium]MBT5458819.1 aspartate dehydrogenase [Rhodospirillaceae bacterium]
MKKIALIGYGAIARIVTDKLREHDPDGKVRVMGILVREARVSEIQAMVGDTVRVVSTIDDLIRLTPNMIVECAGQGAVADYGEAVLSTGIDLMVISTGALADQRIRERLTRAGALTGAHMVLPSGAIAGIDGLNSLRIGGLETVRYTSTKPPLAWKGTPADGNFDLEAITERTVLFTGPASEAARDYPKNANLAATVALAGLGMDDTEIQLVADPSVAPNNVGRIDAAGSFGTLTVECRGLPAPDNPKTSATTALSLTYAILQGTHTIIL